MNDRQAPYGPKALRRGISYQMSARIIQAVLGLVVMVVVVRTMSVGEYALYVTATAAGVTLGQFSLLGLDRVAFRYLPEGRLLATVRDLSRFLSKLGIARLAVVTLLTVATAVCWPWVASVLNVTESALWWVLVYAPVHAAYQYSEVVAQSLMLQRSIRNAASALWISRALALTLWIASTGSLHASEAVWINIASESIGLLMILWSTSSHLKNLHKTSRDDPRSPWRPVWSSVAMFAAQNYLMSQLSLGCKPKIQILVASALLPVESVAAFAFFRNFADKLSKLLPFNLLRTLIEPTMIGRYRESGDFLKVNAAISLILKANLIVALPLAAWLWLAGEPVVSLLTGGKFSELSWIAALLVLWLVTSTQRTLLVIMANAVDLSRALIAASLVGTLATVLLAWMSVPLLGVAALACSDVVFAIGFGLVVVRAARQAGLTYRVAWCQLFRIYGVGISVVSATWAVLVYSGLVVDIRSSVVIGLLIAAVFAAGVIIVRPLSSDEQAMLSRIFPAKYVRRFGFGDWSN